MGTEEHVNDSVQTAIHEMHRTRFPTRCTYSRSHIRSCSFQSSASRTNKARYTRNSASSARLLCLKLTFPVVGCTRISPFPSLWSTECRLSAGLSGVVGSASRIRSTLTSSLGWFTSTHQLETNACPAPMTNSRLCVVYKPTTQGARDDRLFVLCILTRFGGEIVAIARQSQGNGREKLE